MIDKSNLLEKCFLEAKGCREKRRGTNGYKTQVGAWENDSVVKELP